MKVDYEEIGLKCGIEIHQMLDTRHKLFCNCPTVLHKEEGDFDFIRWLRPTRSEVGEMDPAAYFEFKKGVHFRYEGYDDNTCLVEMDEEPPHEMNREALELALMFSLMIGARVLDEIYVMRKIVIDGSNTTGFQRTSLVSIGGKIMLGDKEVPIQTVCVEEDAARKTGENKETKEVHYRLDRLGIPLIEVATAPVIKTPEEARDVALRIGLLLRSLGRVKRGLGTIRQDLNVSIRGGAKIEIKGVQYLDLIPRIIELEVMRQLKLLEIKKILEERNVREEDLVFELVDVSDVFSNTKSKIAKRALKSGGVALALKLKGFGGLVGYEIQPGRRLGTEFADRARYWAEVGGIFHSDELPKYGITEEEVEKIREILGCEKDDAFVLVFDKKKKAEKALRAVWERAIEALHGVPEETRGANPDGTTRFLRPRPGSARMYPETDIRPIRISDEYLESLKLRLPEPPEVKFEKLKKEYGLSEELAKAMFNSQYLYLFEEIVEETGANPVLVASTLTNTLKNLSREGVPVENLSEDLLKDIFRKVASEEIAKEALPELLKILAENPDKNIDEAISEFGLQKISQMELEELVTRIIQENMDYVKARKEKAFGMLMGRVMEKVRGRIDGKIVAKVLREKLQEFISS